MSDFKYIPTPRGYEVRDNGQVLGEIWKNERSYNLRRLIVIRGWSARTADGATIGRGESHIFRTRDEAAKALSEVGGAR